MPPWVNRLLRRKTAGTEQLESAAMIMAVDYQRRGSNFDIDGKHYGIDRTVLTIDAAEIPYERIRSLRVTRSYISGLLGRFSIPGAVLVALGLMSSKRMQCIMRADIIADGRQVHTVSSLSAQGFGRMPVNQIDAFRWFAACLVNRLPPSCVLTVGSSVGVIGGVVVVACATALGALAAFLLREQAWFLGASMLATALAGGWAGYLMLRDGLTRTVDAQGLLAYVSAD